MGLGGISLDFDEFLAYSMQSMIMRDVSYTGNVCLKRRDSISPPD
jgi:hypothetical protein